MAYYPDKLHVVNLSGAETPLAEMQNYLLGSVGIDPRWRSVSFDDLDSPTADPPLTGHRRTFLPGSQKLSDNVLAGGSERFRQIIQPCLEASRLFMQSTVEPSWQPRRVVLNAMPPYSINTLHPDPSTYTSGTCALSFRDARYRVLDPQTGAEHSTEVNGANLIYIPYGWPHEIKNFGRSRLSIVFADDAAIASGDSLLGQKVKDGIAEQQVRAKARLSEFMLAKLTKLNPRTY